MTYGDHTDRRQTTPQRVILGIGTGRCGSFSLTRLLNQQPGVRVSHEAPPLLLWRLCGSGTSTFSSLSHYNLQDGDWSLNDCSASASGSSHADYNWGGSGSAPDYGNTESIAQHSQRDFSQQSSTVRDGNGNQVTLLPGYPHHTDLFRRSPSDRSARCSSVSAAVGLRMSSITSELSPAP